MKKYATEIAKTCHNSFQTGIQFEREQLRKLKHKHIVYNIRKPCFYQTLKAMESKVPIIHNASLRHPIFPIRGICDLLINSNYIPIIFPKLKNIEFEPNIYIPIEIKNILLPLHKGFVLDNYFLYKAKVQLLVYLTCLNMLQTKSFKSLILGNGWYSVTNNHQITGINDPLDRLGLVDYASYDYKLFQTEKNRICS